MHIVINELSFVAQATSYSAAADLMTTLMQIIVNLQKFRREDPICTHSRFYSCELAPQYTVHAWVQSVSNRDTRRLFFEIITKGPYVDKLLDEELDYHECRFHQRDVTSSALAGAAFWQGVLVSLQETPEFQTEHISVQFSTDGENFQNIEICNLIKIEQTKTLCRPYRPSLKHLPPKGHGTPMDLADEIAQEVLIRGVQRPGGKQIYGRYQGRFYEFQPDNAGGYHGYPVQSIPPDVLKIMRDGQA